MVWGLLMNGIDREKIKKTVSEMFKDGKMPGDEWGLTWDVLSKMENDCPELTIPNFKERVK